MIPALKLLVKEPVDVGGFARWWNFGTVFRAELADAAALDRPRGRSRPRAASTRALCRPRRLLAGRLRLHGARSARRAEGQRLLLYHLRARALVTMAAQRRD